MNRKDCDNTNATKATRPGRAVSSRAAGIAIVALLLSLVAAPQALAASVRVWPSAVVVTDEIRLDDLCELTGFQPDQERTLREIVLAKAPVVGGSRIIHLDLIRAGLTGAGANMAQVRLGGATQCAVTRPSAPAAKRAVPVSAVEGGHKGVQRVAGEQPRATLRAAVIDFFNAEFARYGGKAEVVFDRSDRQLLQLTEPTYQFTIRRRGGSPMGLTSLEIDVLAGGETVQRVPLVVQVTMTRRALVARRAINQGASVRDSDVVLMSMSFSRLNQLGLDTTRLAVGQRAKRFIPAGTMIEPSLLEPVPLVIRGQLVTLVARSGGVQVRSTAKAASSGMLGEVVKVRAADNRRVEYDGVVIGPGEVLLGSTAASFSNTRLVSIGGSQ